MPTQECRFPAFPGAWWWGEVAGGPGPCGGEPHLDSTFGVVGRSGWGTHRSRRLGGLWAGSSSQGLDVRLASGAGRGREAWALACPLVGPTSPLCGGHRLSLAQTHRGRPQTTSTRLYAGRELQGSPVWQALAGHKRRIPLAVVLPPPARQVLWAQAWKPSSQHAGEKRGVTGLLLGSVTGAWLASAPLWPSLWT